MKKKEAFERLRSFELFKTVPDDQLNWLLENSEVHQLEVGDYIFKPGEPISFVLIILEGAFKLYRLMGNNEQEIAIKREGEVSGFLPFSRAKVASGFGQVLEPMLVLKLDRSFEKDMLIHHYELSQSLVHEMTTRVREFTNLQVQTEKMAALGKLSAGLAHELNNPASAIVRNAMDMRKRLALQPDKFKRILQSQLSEEQVDAITKAIFQKIQNQTNRPTLKLMEKKALEDDLLFMLEDLGIDDPYDWVEALVEFNFHSEELEALLKGLSDKDQVSVINWIADNLLLEKTVSDIQEASTRIAKLVAAVKGHTHMDQSPDKHRADVHQGLIQTLTLMDHKIKNNGVQVKRHWDESIPNIPMFPGEINQVWTNLLDNAIDALEGIQDPMIVIQSQQNKEEVLVTIEDNGPGIPQEILNRIWEPFFTTKAMGKGSGLGLEFVKNIIEKHKGSISIHSHPGKTQVEIRLPKN